jgi:hypothetical protein
MYYWEMLRSRDRRTFWVREPSDYSTFEEAFEMAHYFNRCSSSNCMGHRLIKVEQVGAIPIYYTLNTRISARA